MRFSGGAHCSMGCGRVTVTECCCLVISFFELEREFEHSFTDCCQSQVISIHPLTTKYLLNVSVSPDGNFHSEDILKCVQQNGPQWQYFIFSYPTNEFKCSLSPSCISIFLEWMHVASLKTMALRNW